LHSKRQLLLTHAQGDGEFRIRRTTGLSLKTGMMIIAQIDVIITTGKTLR